MSFVWCSLIAACASILAVADPVLVNFVVEVPKDTPADAKVQLSGSAPELGNWSGGGLILVKGKDGKYRGSARLPLGTVEYKATCGSWDTVEKNASGGDIANRRLDVKESTDVIIAVMAWASGQPVAQSPPERKPSRSGDIRLHPGFHSKALDNDRDVIVYLPPDYEKNSKQRYPVLYMHDGQNVFDAATSFLGIEWQADEHAERLIRQGKIEPLIIVGIYNTPARMDEYTPQADKGRNAGGKANRYARFLVEEVKPFIDRTYRTRPGREDTGVAGSSLGGLVSLYICAEYPQVFSKCGAISPALMWADRRILRDAKANGAWMKDARIWLDMGTAEGRQIESFNRAVEDTRELVRIFESHGLTKGKEYEYEEVKGAGHNEKAWAERFDRTLIYLFPARK